MNSIDVEKIIEKEALTSKAATVIRVLALHSDKTDECFPGLKRLANKCRFSVRTVQRGLDELLEKGIITKKHNYRPDGSQTSNIYKIIRVTAERINAAVENSMQKINDLRKKMKAIEINKKIKSNQITLDTIIKKQTKFLDFNLFNIFNKIKFSDLAMGGSHIDHPRTQHSN